MEKDIEQVIEEPKKPLRGKNKPEEPKPQKSRKRLGMKEYMLGKPNIRRETQAAIRIKLGDDLFHTKEEWDNIVKEHINQ